MDRTGTRGGDVRSVQEARETQEQSREKARWTLLIREHLRTTLLVTGYLHADDVADLGVPEPHCNLIGTQFASFTNRKLMVKVGERKCEHKAANSRKAAIFRITKLGRETLAGVGAGTPKEQSSDGPSPSAQGCASTDPGESPSAVRRGAQTAAEGTARVGAGVPRHGDAEGPNRAQVRASVHSGEARGDLPSSLSSHPEPARLFEDDPEDDAPPLAYDPYERGQAA